MNYLETQLSNTLFPQQKNYRCAYELKRLQRFIVQFLIISLCQFNAIVHSPVSVLAPPMYLPVGVSFIFCYLFGARSLIALCFIGSVTYALKGLPLLVLFAYTSADLMAGFLGAKFCQNTFATDNPWVYSRREWLQFILRNLAVALLSACLRMLPWLLQSNQHWSWPRFISLWLADTNAILVLFSFSLIWLYVIYSRGAIFQDNHFKKIPCLAAFLIILIPALLLQSAWFAMAMGLCLLISLYLAFRYGIILATALLYFLSFLYLAHAMGHLLSLMSSVLLFFYSVTMLLLCRSKGIYP